MPGPEDEIAATAGGSRGHLRASHTDREQVIGTLKAAFTLVTLASLFYVILLLLIGTPILADWLNERW
jgi:hypothetical protein